jgi:hypothetical protein
MRHNSSSTSSSDAAPPRRARSALITAASAVLCLVLLDLALGVAAGDAHGGDPARASALARYLDYGRSTEGKVRLMLGLDGRKPHPLADSGWIAPRADQPQRPGEGQDLLIAGYGMSFTANILYGMQDLDRRIAVRFAGGPGATLSHSYAMFKADRGHHHAQVIVLGVLASSLPGLVTVSHMTWNFEGPSPHFYPRFSLAGGALSAYVPPVGSLPELQAAAKDAARWQALINELALHDQFYDPLVFRASVLDESTLVRLARRGWGQRSKRAVLERLHNAEGFTNELQLVELTRTLVRSFVTEVERDGKLAVVVAINDRGYADHLHKVLAPILTDGSAVYLSTHEIASASESNNFLRDGHFIPAKDQLMARKLAQAINARLGRADVSAMR